MLPFQESRYYRQYAALLSQSYSRLIGKPLIDIAPNSSVLEQLYHTHFALVSHGIEVDPIFNFANKKALELFEMTWSEFVELPSRLSAEAMNRSERRRMLAQVEKTGFIRDYRGIRISATGKRFKIKQAVVWNVIDDMGEFRGQAARIDQWEML